SSRHASSKARNRQLASRWLPASRDRQHLEGRGDNDIGHRPHGLANVLADGAHRIAQIAVFGCGQPCVGAQTFAKKLNEERIVSEFGVIESVAGTSLSKVRNDHAIAGKIGRIRIIADARLIARYEG